MRDSRDINLMYVKGIGPAKAKLLKEELGLASVYDLLHHFPTHYVDRSQIYRIADFEGEMQAPCRCAAASSASPRRAKGHACA